MKFKLFILIIIFACSLYILAFEGGKINEIVNSDSLSIVYDELPFLRLSVYPDSMNKIHFFIPDTVKVISVYAPGKKLIGVYPVMDEKGEIKKGSYSIMGNIFYEHSINDSALVYYEKAFSGFQSDTEIYRRIIMLIEETTPDILIDYMESAESDFEGNKSVYFINAQQYRKMGLDSLFNHVLLKGTEYADSSHEYLMLLIYRLYYDSEYDADLRNSSIKFALKGFCHDDQMSYIIDYISGEGLFSEFRSELAGCLDNNAAPENILSAAMLYIDEDSNIKESMESLKMIADYEPFSSYKGYIFYYIAKALMYMRDYDEALRNINIADSIYSFSEKDYYMLKFSVDSIFSDSAGMINDIAYMLSMDYRDSTVISDGINMQELNIALDNILNSEIEEIPIEDFNLNTIEEINYSFKNSDEVIFIDFFSTTCSYCKKVMPLLLELHVNNPELTMIGISSETEPDALVKYVKDEKIDFKILYDGRAIFEKFNVRGVPNMIILNRKSGKMFRAVGYMDNIVPFIELRYMYLMKEH